MKKSDREDLGKMVIGFWFSKANSVKLPICRLKEEQPEGTFEVLSYPRAFIPHMDKLIDAWHKTEPPAVEKKKRARIPMKTPVYSTKNK